MLIFKLVMKYKNALCIHPQRKEISDIGIVPPLGLEHIAAVVKNFAERITIIDMRFCSFAESFGIFICQS